ncbi:MAG: hypothetical protein C7N36_07845 [Bacteroidetes bacterium]|nr:MAG: hypothetical protein C7N36_07845 [Bacteroidota bacterium]
MRQADLAVPMIRLLNTYQQLHLLRKREYDEENVARYLLMEEFLLEEKEGIENITLENTLDVLVNGATRRVYIFTFAFGGEQHHLAVVGYFSTDHQDRTFSDGGWVNYTRYTINSRRRMRKAEQLAAEMLPDR